MLHILVTNDDGIDSKGIHALVHELRSFARVTVIAPDRQQSAVGHALTVADPLRATPFHRDGELFGFAVSGTPADCVKLGLTTLMSEKPDLVVSGINHGANTAVNVVYSGTVSAATEGMIMGVPSIAVSLCNFDPDADCTAAAHFAGIIVRHALDLNIPTGTILNVNVPALPREEIQGIKFVPLSRGYWDDRYDVRSDPMQRTYYWIHGKYHVPAGDHESDDGALADGYVAVTPIKFELTDRPTLASLASRFSELQNGAGANPR